MTPSRSTDRVGLMVCLLVRAKCGIFPQTQANDSGNSSLAINGEAHRVAVAEPGLGDHMERATKAKERESPTQPASSKACPVPVKSPISLESQFGKPFSGIAAQPSGIVPNNTGIVPSADHSPLLQAILSQDSLLQGLPLFQRLQAKLPWWRAQAPQKY